MGDVVNLAAERARRAGKLIVGDGVISGGENKAGLRRANLRKSIEQRLSRINNLMREIKRMECR